MQALSIKKPETVAQAVALFRDGEEARYIAGGTDLVPNLRRNIQKAKTLIDVSRIGEMHGIKAESQSLRIGASVTLEALCDSAEVRKHAPLLAKAAAAVAGPTHRATATVGGNLMQDTRCYFYNQSDFWRTANEYCMKCEGDICRVAPNSDRCWACYSGDLAPAMLVLGAEVDITGPSGNRREPLGALYAGDNGMNYLKLAPGDLIVTVEVPCETGWTTGYDKVRVRGSIDFPLAGIAVSLKREKNLVTDLRVACTGVNSYPVLVPGLNALHGKTPDDAFYATLDKAVKKCIQPMETTLTAAGYRRRVAIGMANRLVRQLYAAAGA